jgi:outer membrane protein OmpA-like peptidoglycan-associated protein
MKKQTAVVEEKGESAPLWIISFADMISLLMAFFVMLLTMATPRSGKLCNEGEGIFERTLYGFRNSINSFGIPELLGSANETLNFDNSIIYYSISNGDDTTIKRTIDAREERARRIFNRLDKQTKTLKSQLYGKHPDFVVVPITFGQEQVVLDEPAKQFLNKFIADLHEPSTSNKLTLYVVGLASQEKDEKQQWILSAKRAQTVADFLRNNFPSGSNWSIYSWGAGSGGDWIGKDSRPEQPYIMIAVLKQNE